MADLHRSAKKSKTTKDMLILLSLIIAVCFGSCGVSIAAVIKESKKLSKIRDVISEMGKKINELEERVDKNSLAVEDLTWRDDALQNKIIADCGFPPALTDNLRKANIYTVKDLTSYSFRQLKKIEGVGPKSIKKITAFLKQNKLSLKSENHPK